jgi:polysaccharide export outer membrane protein
MVFPLRKTFSFNESHPGLVAAMLISSCFLFGGCSSSDQSATSTRIIRSTSSPIQQEETESHVIKQGDQMQISVWGYPEFDFRGPVTESGTIVIPLVGETNVAGLTKAEFKETLKKKLAVYIQGEIQLNLSIASTAVQKVAVLGAVVRQDNYTMIYDTPLLEVLTTAGGLIPESDLHHIKILRSDLNRPPLEVDLTGYIETGNISSIPVVRPGDTVIVPRKENLFREASDYLRDVAFLIIFFQAIK